MEALDILKAFLVVVYVALSICFALFLVDVIFTMIDNNKETKQTLNKQEDEKF